MVSLRSFVGSQGRGLESHVKQLHRCLRDVKSLMKKSSIFCALRPGDRLSQRTK